MSVNYYERVTQPNAQYDCIITQTGTYRIEAQQPKTIPSHIPKYSILVVISLFIVIWQKGPIWETAVCERNNEMKKIKMWKK